MYKGSAFPAKPPPETVWATQLKAATTQYFKNFAYQNPFFKGPILLNQRPV